MRLSIIIPVYNRQDAGNKALRSAVAQNVAAEIIVVDDASTPAFQVAPDIDGANIRVVRLDVNCGAAGARNAGFAAATGEWLALLNSDDYWLTGALQPRLDAALRDFARDGNFMRCYAAGFVLANARSGTSQVRIPIGSSDPADFAGGSWFSPGSTLLFHRDSLKRVGNFDASLRRLEDFDWFLRFALAGGTLAVFDQIVAIVEIGRKVSTQHLKDVIDRLRGKYLSETSDNRLSPYLARRFNAYLDIELASSLIAEGKRFTALLYLARSLILVPRLTLHTRQFWTYAPASAANPNSENARDV